MAAFALQQSQEATMESQWPANHIDWDLLIQMATQNGPGDLVLGHENEDKVLEDLPDSIHQDLTRWSDTAAREAGKCSPFSSSQESS